MKKSDHIGRGDLPGSIQYLDRGVYNLLRDFFDAPDIGHSDETDLRRPVLGRRPVLQQPSSCNNDQQQIFRPWEHLLLTRTQAFQVIRDRFDSEFAEEVIYYTYNSDHINRYFSEDYLMAFEASAFEIDQYQLTFQVQTPAQIQEELQQRYPGYAQFANNGVLALLKNSASALATIF